MPYQYRGTHTGPDLFDAPLSRDTFGSPYEASKRDERLAAFAYWYARGYHDEEISAQVGAATVTVRKWRHSRGLGSNYEIVKQ
jgi:hypothetical protein